MISRFFPANRITGLFIFVCLIMRFSSSAQSVTDALEKQLTDYSQSNPQEKIFVHTDKTFYVPGEIIWFKVYVVDARFNIPIDLSKVAYVEVLDKNNVPVLQAKTSLEKGSGKGSFFIPVSVTSGNFKLRAYTRWMRNFDEGFYFEKPLTIINTLKTFTQPTPEKTKYDVQFFPEGGNLVNGMESKVGFKITDQFGQSADASGSLINQQNDTVVRFKTLHAGLGSFSFTPKTGDTYKAIVRSGADSNIVVTLAPAYDAGYTLHVDDDGSQLKVSVNASNQFINETIYLLSHTRNKTNSAEARQIKNNTAVFTIDKSSLPPGITTFTLFNQAKQPVCERLYFKQPGNQNLSVSADNNSYATRSKVNLNIALNGAIKTDDLTDLSLSVYRIDSLQPQDNIDIISYLWLTSDLKGAVESPEYYFTATGKEASEAADNLMLTQGWRRFKWEDVLANKKPSFQFIPEHEGHIIVGKITNKKTGLPVENVLGYLSSPAKKFQFTGGISNAQGLVYFNTKDFTGADQVIVQTNTRQSGDYRIDILNPFSENYATTQLPSLKLQQAMQNQLLNHSVNSQVQTTYTMDSLNRFDLSPYTDTSHFFGTPDKSYYLDDYVRFTTMEEVLREYVVEVAPRRSGRRFHIYVLKTAHEFFENDALVLVDGVPFFDMDSVMAIDPLKIKKLELLTRRYIAGPVTSEGILSYTTYKGDMEGVRLDPNAIIVEYESLQLEREFYAPKYETPARKNNHLPDFRNTLYWSPDVKLNGQQKKDLSFYTGDLDGKYFIMVQGVSGKGNVVSAVSSFDVKK
ncbi:MAG: hypothetical protein QM764_20030 [Chitinophagaceae bacterium]